MFIIYIIYIHTHTFRFLYFIRFARGNQNFINKSKYLEYYLITILLKTYFQGIDYS